LTKIPRSVPSGLSLPWLLALIGGGMVASMLGMVVVNWVGAVTLGGATWFGSNVVVWVALCLLLAGTEQPRITWVMARSSKQVSFSSVRGVAALPKRELTAAVGVFTLIVWNWAAAFGDATVIFPLAAAALGIVRVVRRSPFSRWQWMGSAMLVGHGMTVALGTTGAATSWVPAATVWFQVLLWWMFTHRAVKREDEGLAARTALTQASYFLADGQFVEAERRVRAALPLAATSEIAAAALEVLAATLAGQLRLAEAERALKGSLELDPTNVEARKRMEEIKRVQMV
jgi:hypothetical protein